jgi:hypothetical protein
VADFRFRIGAPATATARVVLPQPVRVQLSAGAQGPAGPVSPGSDGARYEHTQAAASAEWIVNHNLGYRPGVDVLTTGGVRVEADVRHPTVNQVRVVLDVPLAGTAVCS